MRRSAFALVLSAAAASACAPPPPRMCTEEALAAVNVHLIDPRTDAHLRGPATVEVRDGEFAESAAGDLGIVSLAFERAGTYAVRVRAAGFAPWDTAGVRVTEDECHVRPVRLDVRLRPAA